jgi:tetratricopeptide (TPR) repeat protein
VSDASPVRISATLIVRTEAAHLRRCLGSILPFTTEIIVVDTGSEDDSAAIAASFGARVFAFDWQGDFSAARNYALDHATGSWILYIDADEQAQPIERDLLEASLSDPALAAATVRFRNRTGVTRYEEYRLFRNDPRIRFRNVIHETIVPDVMTLVREEGRRVGRSPLALDHFGYDGDQRAKHARNIPLLRARLAVDPEHVYSWNHLGEALAGLGDAQGAVDAWSRAIAIVRGRGVREPIDALPYGSLLLFDSAASASGLLDEARALFPGDLLFQWLDARRLIAAERFGDARELLVRLAGIDADRYCSENGVAYDARIFGPATIEMLAFCSFRLGHYSESARYYSEAAAASPGNLEWLTKQRLAEARAAAPTTPDE